MSEAAALETTVVETAPETETVTPKKKAKKMPKPPVAKSVKLVKAAKTTEKPEPKAKTSPNDSVTKPQLRVLEVLSKAKNGLNAARIAEKASIAKTWVTGFVRKAGKANRTPALVEQKLVKAIELDLDGKKEFCFEITATGRKLVEKAK